MMKKIFSFLFVLCLCLSIGVQALAVVDQSESFYVADYSNVLSNNTEQMIINYNGSLEQQCQGAQIVVVTVDYLDGMYSDEYAYQLFNDWGVGSADYNNGMLLLLAIQENKAWLAYGLGLNSLLDSDQVDSMLDKYFWKDFDRGNYDEAVTNLFKVLLAWYDKQYDSQVVSSGSSNGTYYEEYAGPGFAQRLSSVLGSIIRVVVVIAILSLIFGSGRRRGGGGSWLPWFLLFNSRGNNRRGGFWDDDHRNGPKGPGGFGGGGFGGGGFGGGGFGGGSGHGGGGFSGGGGGRR